MNTYNRIAGAQAGVDTTRGIMELEARRLDQDDNSESVYVNLPDMTRAYRRACEAYAESLDLLADAIRGGK